MRLLTVLLVLLSFTMQAQDKPGCAKLRTGKFYIKDEHSTTRITRTKDRQVEVRGDVKITLKVEWIDECSYKLTFLKGNEAWTKDHPGNDNPPLIVTITNVHEDGYDQEAVFVGLEGVPPYKSKVFIDK